MVFRRMVRHAAWGFLALALLLAPLLGLIHGVVHGAGGPLHGQQAHVHLAQDHDHAHEHADGHGWLADVFSVHADDADCRVYDQLCHGDGVSAAPALVLPIALSAFVFHFLEGEVLARRAALFEARGPPLTR
jgi:hypothetical protein